MEYLHITEYSSLMHSRIPRLRPFEHEYQVGESIFRAYVDSCRVRVKEDYDNTLASMEEEAKLEEKTIPLDGVILVDDVDIDKETQKLAFVYECPVCLSKTITTSSQFDFCPHCENNKFSPEVVGLISVPTMEDIAVNHPDNTTLIQVKNDEVVFKDRSREDKKRYDDNGQPLTSHFNAIN